MKRAAPGPGPCSSGLAPLGAGLAPLMAGLAGRTVGLARLGGGLAVLCAGLAACGVDRAHDGSEGTARGSIVDTVRARPVATIGVIEGDERYAFGDITSVAADETGRIYVADRIGSLIRVYAPDGSFLARIGREGEGPGEFVWPTGLSFGPDGTLYVRDINRITLLAPSEPGAIPDSPITTWRISGYATTSQRRSAVGPDGHFFYPAYRFPTDGTPQHFFLVYSPSGDVTLDTLRVPKVAGMEATMVAHYMIGPGTGRMVYGLSRGAFSPGPTWTVTPAGTVLSSDGRDYRLIETDLAGDTIRVIEREVAPRPVPAAERDDSARALAARIDSLEVPFDDVIGVAPEIRDGVWPGRLPEVLSLHVATDGALWVGRWPSPGLPGARVFDVLEPSGAPRAVVIVPARLESDPPPFFTEDGVYGVVQDPETGVQRVAALSFER